MKKIDEKILNFIDSNSKTTTSIFNELDISRETAYRRLRSLEKFGFIDCDETSVPYQWGDING